MISAKRWDRFGVRMLSAALVGCRAEFSKRCFRCLDTDALGRVGWLPRRELRQDDDRDLRRDYLPMALSVYSSAPTGRVIIDFVKMRIGLLASPAQEFFTPFSARHSQTASATFMAGSPTRSP